MRGQKCPEIGALTHKGRADDDAPAEVNSMTMHLIATKSFDIIKHNFAVPGI